MIITFLPTFIHIIKSKKNMATVEKANDATPTRLAPDSETVDSETVDSETVDSEFRGPSGPAPSSEKNCWMK